MVVLDVDASKRRVSLGLKQAAQNPWEEFLEKHPVGSAIEGEVKNATEFGLFIGLDDDIDGMVHFSDIDWNVAGEEAMARYTKGDMVKAQVLDVDVEKERISLGIKQLAGDPMTGDQFRKGQTVTAQVIEVTSGGIEVKFGPDDAPATSFIRKSDLSRDRSEQRPERYRRRRSPRRPGDQCRQGGAPRLPVGQGSGNGRGKGSHRQVRLDRQRRLPRRHPRRGPPREGLEQGIGRDRFLPPPTWGGSRRREAKSGVGKSGSPSTSRMDHAPPPRSFRESALPIKGREAAR